jgi:hypothetical protein
LSCYTHEIQSHIIRVLRKRLVFSHPQTISLRLFVSLRFASAMDKQPSKNRRLAAATLLYKDEMENELNRTLPNAKRGFGSRPVQSAPLTKEIATEPEPIPTLPIAKRGFGSHPAQSSPLTEEVVAPVEVQPTSAPPF